MRAVRGGLLGPLAVGCGPAPADAGVMIQRVVILGGGTAGTLTANRLRRELGDQATITVVDRDDDHLYQPGLPFVPFGRPITITPPEQGQRSRVMSPRSLQVRSRREPS